MDSESVQVPTNALVLVSDGRRMRLLRNQGTPVKPQLIVEHSLDRPVFVHQGLDGVHGLRSPPARPVLCFASARRARGLPTTNATSSLTFRLRDGDSTHGAVAGAPTFR